MFDYRWGGNSIEVFLPDKPEHTGYYIDCRYKFNKQKQKYSVSMYLMHKGDEAKCMLTGCEIDTQLITSDRENIENNIVRIVEQAFSTGYFDEYIDNYEYTCECIYKGDEFYSAEYEKEYGGGKNV